MQIKLLKPKNVYGVRQSAGKVLTIGSDIPEWQAARFIELGLAAEYTSPSPKNKSAKKASRK
jgi:hypothetical protein